MAFTAVVKLSAVLASICLVVKEIRCCDYEFANLDGDVSLDWSTGIDSVVYTVQVTKLPENVNSTDVLLQIDPLSSKFKLNEANKYQVLVAACLEHGQNYVVEIRIVNDSNCATGILSFTTDYAIPQFNMATTTFFAIPDEDPFKPLTEAFKIEITNDYAFGGCGSFTCTSVCTSDGTQNYAVDTDTKILSATWALITYDVLYNLKVTCLDDIAAPNTDDHSINVDLTFVLTMPTPEPATTTTSTSVIRKKATSEPTTTTTSISTEASISESAELTTTVSNTRQTSTASMTPMSTKLDTSKSTSISPFVSGSTTLLFLTKTSIPKLITTSILLQQTSSVEQSSKSPNFSTNTASISPSATAILRVSGSVSMTGSSSSSVQVNTGFFSKPENIVTVVLPAIAFSGFAIFGIGYIIYKKGLNKANITPVIGL